MKRRIDWAIAGLLAALAVGAYFRFWDLTSQSLFLDEGYTFMVAGKSWPDMIHVWQVFASMLDEGRQAIEKIGQFISTHTA